MSGPGTDPLEPTTKRNRNWRFKLAAVGLVLFVTLLLGEGLARLAYPDPSLFERSDRWIAHPTLGRRLRPAHDFESGGVRYATNELGLRDVERPVAEPPGTRRVVIVGDSFVYGIGPHAAIFPQLTEASLHDRGRTDFRVMPVGQPGFGTLQQATFVREFLAEHEFSLLVLAFCVGNDVTENRRVMKGNLPQPPQPGLVKLALERSRLVQAFRGARRGINRSGHKKFDDHVRRRMRLAVPAIFERADWQRAEDATIQAIEDLAAFAAEHQARFAVLLLPDEYQLDAALRSRIAASTEFQANFPDAELQPRLVQERLTAALTARNLTVIDPFPAFEAAHEPGRLFIPYDTHYNAEGNGVLADALAAWIEQQIPASDPPR